MRHWPLISFFALANLLSWVAWAPLTVAGLGWTATSFSPYLHLLGGLGPLIAALVVTTVCDGRAGVARLVTSCVSVRGRLPWVVLAVAAPVVLFAISAVALSIAGGHHVEWAGVGRSAEFPDLGRGGYWIANIILYGFDEEVGWRGFALPRLQARHSALSSALLVGVGWAAWHLPLFAFSGGLSSMGVGGIAGWLFSILTGSVLMTWLFNSSRGSLLAVALFHGVLDIVMTSPVAGPLPSVMGAIIIVAGIAIPFAFGKTNLSRASRVQWPEAT